MYYGDKPLLPDGVDELAPPVARQLELLRRRVLDYYHAWGYDQLSPTLIEYAEVLCPQNGQDLDLLTFKVTDQVSGRTLGVRADITPQVSRMATDMLVALPDPTEKRPLRLCYSEPVLHALPMHLKASRTLLQTGAELYGPFSFSSDIEMIRLMVESLELVISNPEGLVLGLGHAGVQSALFSSLDLDLSDAEQLRSIFQRKSRPDLIEFIDKLSVQDDGTGAKKKWSCLLDLLELQGSKAVLSKAAPLFAALSPEVVEKIDYLIKIAEQIEARYPNISLYFDLADHPGYRYHTGLVFCAYHDLFSHPIARGGRYDWATQAHDKGDDDNGHGLSSAIGYSMDLMAISKVALKSVEDPAKDRVYAPLEVPDPVVNQMRKDGYRVIVGCTSDTSEAVYSNCQLVLTNKNGHWELESLDG